MELLGPAIALLVAAWVLRFVTWWTFPFAKPVADWVGHNAWRLLRCVFRLLRDMGWRKPVRQHGVPMTLFVWTLAGGALLTLAAFITLNVGVLALGALSWLSAAAIWLYLRWSTERRYRFRPLPQRRQGRNEPW